MGELGERDRADEAELWQRMFATPPTRRERLHRVAFLWLPLAALVVLTTVLLLGR